MKHAFFALAILAVTSSAHAATQTQTWFYDSCSGQRTGVTTSSTAHLVVEVQGLSSDHRVEMRVNFSPDGDPQVAAEMGQSSLWQNSTDEKGKVRFEVDFSVPALDAGQPRLWVARASWRDLQLPELSGSADARIYLAINGEERIYALTGPLLCQWQADPALMHPYRSNPSGYVVSLEREVNFSWLTQNHGVDTISLSSREPSKSGIFFPQWESLYGTAAQRLKQSWQIPMNSGGYLATRLKFTRYAAKELRQKKVNGCKTWTEGRSGFLDVGSTDTDFFIVPSDYATDDDLAVGFIKSAYPFVSTCEGQLPKAEPNARVPLSSVDYPMYFYAR